MYLLNNEPHFQENAVLSLLRKLQVRTDRVRGGVISGNTVYFFVLILKGILEVFRLHASITKLHESKSHN